MQQLEHEDEKVNLTDADAKPIKSHGRIESNYNGQAAVNMDGVIVAAYATNAASDKEQLTQVVRETQQNTQQKPENILADAGYASYENYEWLDEQNIVAYIPDQEFKQKKIHEQQPYHRDHFRYDSAADDYTCPQGQKLIFSRIDENKKKKQKSKVYKAIACPQCPVRTSCTTSQHRTIYQEYREPLRKQARDRLSSEEGKALYQKRMHTIEPRWANIKFNRKFKMFHLRGLKKVNAEFKLMCLAENILTLHRKKIKPAS